MPVPGLRRELPPTAGLPPDLGDYLRRPFVALAQGVAAWLDILEPAVTCSGTAAFVAILRVLSRREPFRTEVVLPGYTCPLMPLAVTLAGLTPVLCDLRPESVDLDPDHLARLCSGRTLAVVPTHLGGRVADVVAVRDVAESTGAAIIEDAAQALGATVESKSVGLAGDASFFSLAVGKGLTMFEGGLAYSPDPDLHRELMAEAAGAAGGAAWNVRRNLELLAYHLTYRPFLLGLVYGRALRRHLASGDEEGAVGDRFSLDDIPVHRPDALRQRVAANALSRLPQYLEQGRIRAARRIERLRQIRGLTVIDDPEGRQGVWPFFIVLMPDQASRDKALNALWGSGLGVSKLFVHALPDYDFLDLDVGSLPHARDLANRMLTISNSHWLADQDFDRIMNTLGENL